ncbi:hypothetical protein NDU88_008260 [Pleurodeles waltl]|uniref:Uncharacterized protein n=1 Tax=Pleurodeles waltl TaxID=8319 RepID=A0AAV7N8A9_PLEWA|nr:hypothetical protein NDU88_008260 [Pleurodeles waltl]
MARSAWGDPRRKGEKPVAAADPSLLLFQEIVHSSGRGPASSLHRSARGNSDHQFLMPLCPSRQDRSLHSHSSAGRRGHTPLQGRDPGPGRGPGTLPGCFAPLVRIPVTRASGSVSQESGSTRAGPAAATIPLVSAASVEMVRQCFPYRGPTKLGWSGPGGPTSTPAGRLGPTGSCSSAGLSPGGEAALTAVGVYALPAVGSPTSPLPGRSKDVKLFLFLRPVLLRGVWRLTPRRSQQNGVDRVRLPAAVLGSSQFYPGLNSFGFFGPRDLQRMGNTLRPADKCFRMG